MVEEHLSKDTPEMRTPLYSVIIFSGQTIKIIIKEKKGWKGAEKKREHYC